MYNFNFFKYFNFKKVNSDNNVITYKSDEYDMTLKIDFNYGDEYFTIIAVKGITVLSLTIERDWTLAFIDDIITSMLLKFHFQMKGGDT